MELKPKKWLKIKRISTILLSFEVVETSRVSTKKIALYKKICIFLKFQTYKVKKTLQVWN